MLHIYNTYIFHRLLLKVKIQTATENGKYFKHLERKFFSKKKYCWSISGLSKSF